MEGKCMDWQEGSVFVSERELYSTRLLGTGGQGSPGHAVSTAANVSPGVAYSATETAPS